MGLSIHSIINIFAIIKNIVSKFWLMVHHEITWKRYGSTEY